MADQCSILGWNGIIHITGTCSIQRIVYRISQISDYELYTGYSTAENVDARVERDEWVQPSSLSSPAHVPITVKRIVLNYGI